MTNASTIREAIRDGVIRLITDPIMEFGTVAAIGDTWFYFGGELAEELSPNDYLLTVGEETVASEIAEVVNANGLDEDERQCNLEALLSESLLSNCERRYCVKAYDRRHPGMTLDVSSAMSWSELEKTYNWYLDRYASLDVELAIVRV